MTDTTLPRKHPVLEIAEFDTELVVYDPRVHRVHHVKALTALVLDACDGATARADLVDELAEGLSADQSAIEAAVAVEIEALTAAGLLEGTEPPADPPPCLGCGGESDVQIPGDRPSRSGRWSRKQASV